MSAIDQCVTDYERSLICRNHALAAASVIGKKGITIHVGAVGQGPRDFIVNRADGTKVRGQIVCP